MPTSSIAAALRRPSGDASGADVLLEPDDARELVDVEAGAADERAVDVRLAHERRRCWPPSPIRRRGCACLRDLVADELGEHARGAPRTTCWACSRRRRLAGADRPDGLVGDDESRRARRRPSSAARSCATGTALGPCVSRSSAVSPTHTTGTSPCRCAAATLASTSVVGLAVQLPALGVPDDHVAAVELREERARDLAGVGAGVVRREVLRAVARSAARRPSTSVCTRAQVGERREDRDLGVGEVVLRVLRASTRASARTRSTAGGRGSSSSCPR